MITTKADSQKRVVLPEAKPGEVYDVRVNADGSFTLTAVKPAESAVPQCQVGREDGYTVVVPGQAINEQAIKELMADFP